MSHTHFSEPREKPQLLGRDLREPERGGWPDNGRVEVVVDPNWLIDGQPRVVRRVGWRHCMCCRRRFFSADIAKVRICDACKDVKTDMSCGGREFVHRRSRWSARNSSQPQG